MAVGRLALARRTARPPRPPLVFLIAGEASGDAIGAKLMRELRHQHPSPLRFEGVGGEQMQREGLRSQFPLADLSVAGFAEVITSVPRLALRLLQTMSAPATAFRTKPA